jgi:flagellar basal-body rod protein FlgC
MDFLTSMALSASGMSAQRMRMNIISSNMANANSTKTADGGPYRRRQVVVSAVPLKNTFEGELSSAVDRQLRKVQLSSIQLDQTPFRLVHNPGHPHADEKGYVKMPNVSVIQEMANMIDATRGYEANLAVLNSSKRMALKALEIAR